MNQDERKAWVATLKAGDVVALVSPEGKFLHAVGIRRVVPSGLDLRPEPKSSRDPTLPYRLTKTGKVSGAGFEAFAAPWKEWERTKAEFDVRMVLGRMSFPIGAQSPSPWFKAATVEMTDVREMVRVLESLKAVDTTHPSWMDLVKALAVLDELEKTEATWPCVSKFETE